MYKYELFLKSGSGGIPILKIQPHGGESFDTFKTPTLTRFTPLRLTLASVESGNVKPSLDSALPSLQRTKIESCSVGYIELPSFGGAPARGYQLLAYTKHNIEHEFPRGELHPTDIGCLQFYKANNTSSFSARIDELVPLGKLLISDARHAGELQQELRGHLALGYRQTSNLQGKNLKRNSFLHAGEFVQPPGKDYSCVLVLEGHFVR